MKNKAFTLYEIIIVVAIVGLLLGIAVPSFDGIRKEQEFLEEATQIGDILADARANAISSRQCDIDGTLVQSTAWALRMTQNGTDYNLQLVCETFEPVACTNGVNGCSGTEHPIGFYPQNATGHLPTDGPVLDRFVRTVSQNGRIDRIGVTAFSDNTNDITITSGSLEVLDNLVTIEIQPNPSGPFFNVNLEEDNRNAYSDFSIIFTDLAEEVYFDVTGETENLLAQDFSRFVYISIENKELGYEGGNDAENLLSNYGICFDTRQGFPVFPCSMDLTLD